MVRKGISKHNPRNFCYTGTYQLEHGGEYWLSACRVLESQNIANKVVQLDLVEILALHFHFQAAVVHFM